MGFVVPLIGLAISAAGTVGGLVQGQKAAKAQKQAEKLRQNQMNLDAQRQKRETIRRGLAGQAAAESSAANQGALGGSGLQGALGQISANTGRGQGEISQNQGIGNQIFAANGRYADATSRASMFQGLGSLGGTITDNAPTINRIFGIA